MVFKITSQELGAPFEIGTTVSEVLVGVARAGSFLVGSQVLLIFLISG